MTIPVYARHPLFVRESFPGMCGQGKRPLHIHVRTNADEKQTLSTLRHTVIDELNRVRPIHTVFEVRVRPFPYQPPQSLAMISPSILGALDDRRIAQLERDVFQIRSERLA